MRDGIFDGFVDDKQIRLIGVEAGERIAPGRHAARFAGGSTGVLQDAHIHPSGRGRQHPADTLDFGRARLRRRRTGTRVAARSRTNGISFVTDEDALDGFTRLARSEGFCRRWSPRTRSRTVRLMQDVPDGNDRAREPVGPRRQGRAERRRAFK